MRYRSICIAMMGACLLAGPAMAQEVTQPPAGEAAAPSAEEAKPEGCVLAQPPPRLTITMPTEPKLPSCAAKNNCSKPVADACNAAVTAHNKAVTRANEASGDYVDKLNDFGRGTSRYVNCEIDRLNASMGIP
jgi:hypothetical protein